MASSGGGAGPNSAESFDAPSDREILEISSDSGSESSIAEAESPNPFQRPCQWRTDEFHDQECSRFFDCPSHTVERALSDDEAEPYDEPRDAMILEDDGEHRETDQDLATDQLPQESETASHSTLGAPGTPDHEGLDETGQRQTTEGARGEIVDLTMSPGPEGVDEGPSPGDASPPDVGYPPVVGPSAATSTAPVPQEIIDLTGNDTPPPQIPHADPAPSLPRQRPSITSLPGARPPLERAVHPSELSLPRWQPDAEVTLCPICRTQFSFFVRKHHCRKCGRVVCNACSPHRITIPYQYIVQPPEQPRLSAQRYPSSFIGGDSGYGDYHNIGGGERVRLCNPCVPDPNTTPPQHPLSPTPTSPRTHGRSQSNVSLGFGGGQPPSRFQGYFAANPGLDPLARHRSVTHSGPGLGAASSSRVMYASPYNSTQNRILAGTPPSYFPSSSSAYPGASSRRYQSMLDVEASSSSSRERALPPPPPPLDEEDECPVCHRELPSRTLPNFEAVRESHITTCISTHSAYISGGTPTEGSRGDANNAGTPPPFAMRLTGMFPYIATEKDCVDSAECTICLEEFEVGVQMARLECLCRFHKKCISDWFVDHPGRCPVHQHDSFGY